MDEGEDGGRTKQEERLVKAYHERLEQRGIADYSFEACWSDYVFIKGTGMQGAAVVGMVCSRQFQTQTGPFADDGGGSDVEASRRWDAFVGRVAADLKHHDYGRSVLGPLSEVPEGGSGGGK